jgi:hypothetical protein
MVGRLTNPSYRAEQRVPRRTPVEQMMTRRQVAETLQVTTRCVDKWLRRPDVPLRAVKLGGVVRIPASDVRALVQFREPANERGRPTEDPTGYAA